MNSKIIIATPDDLKKFILSNEIDLTNVNHLKDVHALIWFTMEYICSFETKKEIINEIDWVLEISKKTYQNKAPRFGMLSLTD
jgi:hypothetical protein